MDAILSPKVLLQVLILTFGIYLLLSFLRTTRGSGLVTGVSLILILGVYGMGLVAQTYELVEIEGIIAGLQAMVFVIIAIIFQPELRRGIFALTENPLLGRFLGAHRKEVVAEVAAAVQTMAKKKQGALIAFERKTPLDAYIDGAVKLDSEVNRLLLDSIFQHGGTLHDGAVIIRGDRLVAAASLFPLTENVEISKSTGTRHRAALGLTEETDAVTICVSEETGIISICKRGAIERRIPQTDVEEVLRNRVGSDETAGNGDDPTQERAPWFLRALSENVGQKFAALLLASLVFYGAYKANTGELKLDLYIVQVDSPIPAQAQGKALRVVLPQGHRLSPNPTGETFTLSFSGPREMLSRLQESGLWQIEAHSPSAAEDSPGESFAGRTTLLLDLAGLTHKGVELDREVDVSWAGDPPPLMSELFSSVTLQLDASMIEIDGTELDERYEMDLGRIVFHPSHVPLTGPQTIIAQLGQGTSEEGPLLAGVRLGAGHQSSQRLASGLCPAWEDVGITLEVERIEVEVPVRPVEVECRALDLVIGLQHLDPGYDPQAAGAREFEAPSKRAQVSVFTRGLVRGDRDSDDWVADRSAIVGFVKNHLRVFVDVDAIPPGSDRSRIQTLGLEDWRVLLPLEAGRFAQACQDAAPGDLRIVFDEPEIQLVEIQPKSPAPGQSPDSGEI
jgi:diadenylate cyclase